MHEPENYEILIFEDVKREWLTLDTSARRSARLRRFTGF
jgi:hypothetical protein